MILAVWFGTPAFEAFLAVAGVLMAREWGRLADGGQSRTPSVALGAMVVLLVVVAWLGAPFVASLILLVVGTAALFVFAGQAEVAAPRWMAGGVIAIGLPLVCFVALRNQADIGRATMFWLFAVVWATDIGAFAFGRAIGGPKLAPRVSPNKTWAGLGGGMLWAGVAGLGTAIVTGADPLRLVLVSALLAVIAQCGDLGESYLKRHFGVKDSGGLIPGHGGILDRVDGLLAAAPAAALLIWLSGGELLR